MRAKFSYHRTLGFHPHYVPSLRSSSLSVVILITIITTTLGCVRNEETEKSEQTTRSNRSPLEEIKAELERPRKQGLGKTAPSPTPENSGWYGLPKLHQPSAPSSPQAAAVTPPSIAEECAATQAKIAWPIDEGAYFPIFDLLTPQSQKRSTESFRGRPTLIEYASMGSSVTQAFAGANERGGYGNVPLNKNYKSLELYFPEYAGGVHANSINLVQIVMANERGESPTAADVTSWSQFFELETRRGRIVLIGSSTLLNRRGFEIVGGFQLLDKHLVVRADATRERSKTLFSKLFPFIARVSKM